MLSDSVPLTSVQQQVLASLAAGSTVSAAAEEAGVHRNTIANWRKSSTLFRDQYQSLPYEQALHWRDALQGIAPLALETLRYAMANMNTPPSVRVRAALAILEKVIALPPSPPCTRRDNVVTMPPQPTVQSSPEAAATKNVQPRKVAQSCTTEKPSRDALCPCGSARKYKYCCLGKERAA